MFDHWTPKTGETLKKDAKVVDFTQWKCKYNKYKFESTVFFDDRFKYVSYKTESRSYLSSITVYTTKELNLEIVEKAVKKHKELLEKSSWHAKAQKTRKFKIYESYVWHKIIDPVYSLLEHTGSVRFVSALFSIISHIIWRPVSSQIFAFLHNSFSYTCVFAKVRKKSQMIFTKTSWKC